MVRIPRFKAEVRLFICGYHDLPLISTNGKLDHPSVPMWVLMRAGGTNANDMDMFGLRSDPGMSDWLGATFEGEYERLSVKPAEVMLRFIHDFAPNLKKGKLRKYIQGQKGKNFPIQTSHVHLAGAPGREVFRTAVLVPGELTFDLSFTVSEGFGVSLDRKSIAAMAKREKVPLRLLSGGIRTDAAGIRGNWSFDPEDIRFVQKALSEWEKISIKTRAKHYDLTSLIQYN